MKTQETDTKTARWAALAALALLLALPGCRDMEEPQGLTDGDLNGISSDCIAPDRAEYKAAHGIYGDDDVENLESYEGMEHTILFIFDKSGSMTTPWDHRNKWAVARDAMVDSVDKYKHYLSAGAIFFPTDINCAVAPIISMGQIDYGDGEHFLGRWEALMNMYGPDGQTPLNKAFHKADQAIDRACGRGILQRPFKVVLLTDGEPNCDYDYEKLLSYPKKWIEQGIETHVIGLPGSEEAEDLLEQIATEGGSDLFLLESTDDPDQAEEDVEDFGDEVDIACE
jgi:Mg-chelatase subunit ChlD